MLSPTGPAHLSCREEDDATWHAFTPGEPGLRTPASLCIMLILTYAYFLLLRISAFRSSPFESYQRLEPLPTTAAVYSRRITALELCP